MYDEVCPLRTKIAVQRSWDRKIGRQTEEIAMQFLDLGWNQMVAQMNRLFGLMRAIINRMRKLGAKPLAQLAKCNRHAG